MDREVVRCMGHCLDAGYRSAHPCTLLPLKRFRNLFIRSCEPHDEPKFEQCQNPIWGGHLYAAREYVATNEPPLVNVFHKPVIFRMSRP